MDPYLRASDTLRSGRALDHDTSRALLDEMLSGRLGDLKTSAILALLSTHTPTPDELTGAARAMREHSTKVAIPIPEGAIILDTCGTGGAPKTFNVSTAAAFVLSGVTPPPESGCTRILVAKHGNKSRTGRGSAEVMSELGVGLDTTPETQSTCLIETGICFCFAVNHHPAVKHAMPARRALGHPTIFNALGPLTNPADAHAQLIGVYDDALLEPIARTLVNLGATRGMVVHSLDGLDELATTSPARCIRITPEGTQDLTIDPERQGFRRAFIQEITANDPAHGAKIIRSILDNQDTPHRDTTILTAAGALYGAGITPDMESGIERANDSIASGRAQRALEDLIERTRVTPRTPNS